MNVANPFIYWWACLLCLIALQQSRPLSLPPAGFGLEGPSWTKKAGCHFIARLTKKIKIKNTSNEKKKKKMRSVLTFIQNASIAEVQSGSSSEMQKEHKRWRMMECLKANRISPTLGGETLFNCFIAVVVVTFFWSYLLSLWNKLNKRCIFFCWGRTNSKKRNCCYKTLPELLICAR